MLYARNHFREQQRPLPVREFYYFMDLGFLTENRGDASAIQIGTLKDVPLSSAIFQHAFHLYVHLPVGCVHGFCFLKFCDRVRVVSLLTVKPGDLDVLLKLSIDFTLIIRCWWRW